MRILITGCQGVLGSVLLEELRMRGHDVWGCDLTHSEDPKVFRADVADRFQLSRVIERSRPSLVYHLAAEFGRRNGEDYSAQLWTTNCVGTRNVIEECIKRAAVLVFASSSEAYGISDDYAGDRPLAEAMLDDHVPRFHNEYALSKYTNERQIHAAVRNQGLNAIVLRFFNVYGPPELYSPYRSVVCQFIYQMLNGDDLTINRGGFRSHLWIGDWCRTVANIPERLKDLLNIRDWPGSAGTPYTPTFNIGGHGYESTLQLFRRLERIIPPYPNKNIILDSEPANTATKCPDNTLAEEYLDHFPKMGLDDGLKATVDFMRDYYDFD